MRFAEPTDPLRQLANRLVPNDKNDALLLFFKILLLASTCKHRDILHNMLRGTDEEILADLDAIDTDCECLSLELNERLFHALPK